VNAILVKRVDGVKRQARGGDLRPGSIAPTGLFAFYCSASQDFARRGELHPGLFSWRPSGRAVAVGLLLQRGCGVRFESPILERRYWLTPEAAAKPAVCGEGAPEDGGFDAGVLPKFEFFALSALE
jgi:hypothetical protein